MASKFTLLSRSLCGSIQSIDTGILKSKRLSVQRNAHDHFGRIGSQTNPVIESVFWIKVSNIGLGVETKRSYVTGFLVPMSVIIVLIAIDKCSRIIFIITIVYFINIVPSWHRSNPSRVTARERRNQHQWPLWMAKQQQSKANLSEQKPLAILGRKLQMLVCLKLAQHCNRPGIIIRMNFVSFLLFFWSNSIPASISGTPNRDRDRRIRSFRWKWWRFQ